MASDYPLCLVASPDDRMELMAQKTGPNGSWSQFPENGVYWDDPQLDLHYEDLVSTLKEDHRHGDSISWH